ncbi:MAG TPA: SIS domain-containing protein, partial [Candidatus Dormibacteraeota bacterium]|nr:SIS domain-containing protein [Candidatus Dormibacteraeota bacterium]
RPETPVGPGSTLSAVAIGDAIKVRTAELLLAKDELPPVITSAAEVGRKRSEELFEAAYREHARRASRSLAT